jgi:adenosylmethionine-8-amino-7-oxononanoate aminotransferase
MKHPVFPLNYSDLPILDYGEGVFLFDKDGNRYIDASSEACVVSIGHGREEVADAMRAQAKRAAYVIGVHFQNEASLELSKQIIELAPDGMNSVHYVSGGSEGNDTAMKLALSYQLARNKPRKSRFICRWASYHGATLAAVSLSGHTGRRRTYHRVLMDVTHIPPAFCYHCPFSKTPERSVDEYFPLIREICTEHDVLLIADEVMTGFGRTGKAFGVDNWKVVPDIIVTGKGVSSGYTPLGAVIVGEKIDEVFKETQADFPHIFTFAFNPLSAATGLAVVRILQREGLIQQAEKRGRYLKKQLSTLEDIGIVGNTRGLGMLQGVEFVENKETKEPFSTEKNVARRMFEGMKTRGVIPYYGTGTADGTRGDHLVICPPFVIKEEQIYKIVESIRETAIDLEKQL